METAMPLVLVLRDVLSLVDNTKEVKRVLHEGKVLIDGVLRRDHRFAVGIFDIVTIPDINKSWIVMLDHRGKLVLREIKKGDNKIVKIIGKTTVKGGKTQLHFHDGTNMISSEKYATKGSLILKIPDRKVVEHLPFEVGAFVLVIGGSHVSEQGKIAETRIQKSSQRNIVVIENGEGNKFETVENYVYVIGRDKPVIDLGATK